MLASWLPRSLGSGWKRFLLRLFGAKISPTAVVYSSAKVYYPANLTMDAYSCIASDVDCYNVASIHIGKFATVSQYAFLCTASHDIKWANLCFLSVFSANLGEKDAHSIQLDSRQRGQTGFCRDIMTFY